MKDQGNKELNENMLQLHGYYSPSARLHVYYSPSKSKSLSNTQAEFLPRSWHGDRLYSMVCKCCMKDKKMFSIITTDRASFCLFYLFCVFGFGVEVCCEYNWPKLSLCVQGIFICLCLYSVLLQFYIFSSQFYKCCKSRVLSEYNWRGLYCHAGL